MARGADAAIGRGMTAAGRAATARGAGAARAGGAAPFTGAATAALAIISAAKLKMQMRGPDMIIHRARQESVPPFTSRIA
jgi:hypothetical protein